MSRYFGIVILLIWADWLKVVSSSEGRASLEQGGRFFKPGRRTLQDNGTYVYLATIDADTLGQLVASTNDNLKNDSPWFYLSPPFETQLLVPDATRDSSRNLERIEDELTSLQQDSQRNGDAAEFTLDRDYFIIGSDSGRLLPTIFAPNYLSVRVHVTNPVANRTRSENGTTAPGSDRPTTVTFSQVTLWLPHIVGGLDNVTMTDANNQDWQMDAFSRTCFFNSTIVATSCEFFINYTNDVFQVLCFTTSGLATATDNYFQDLYDLPKERWNSISCIAMQDVKPPPGLPTSKQSSKRPRLLWAYIVVPLVVALILLAAFFMFVRHRRYEKSMQVRLAESEAQKLDLLKMNISATRDGAMSNGKHIFDLNVSSKRPKIIERPKQTEELSVLQDQLQNLLNTPTDEAHITVEAEIGRGAYGVVYKGLWKNMRVAIKTILFQASQDLRDEPVIREACIALRVSHENLVATYHADVRYLQSPGQQLGTACQMYLVQEFCDVGTLYTSLAQARFHHSDVADKAIIVRCILDIALGIRALHDADIIHGDLKPQNVLLTSIGNGKQVERIEPKNWSNVAKLTDFGLSFRLESKSHLSNLHVGTPFYLAPEVQSTGHLSKASDVYSLGVLMWEMYHGRPPYVTQNGRLMQNSTFPRFTSTSAPFSFAVLTLACLSKDHLQRPSIEEVLLVMEDLNQAINSGDAMVAISADVPALLMRLMKCSGLKRDPAFYSLIQKADASKLKAPPSAATDKSKAADGDDTKLPANGVNPDAVNVVVEGQIPVLSCHNGMVPVSAALLSRVNGTTSDGDNTDASWPIVEVEDALQDRTPSA